MKTGENKFYTGVPDKLLIEWLGDKEYIVATDEGEAVGIGAGYYIATKKRANVFMSADGFCNALNPLTSLVIPEKIKLNLIISVGREEPAHVVMTKALRAILKAIKYDPRKISIKLIEKE